MARRRTKLPTRPPQTRAGPPLAQRRQPPGARRPDKIRAALPSMAGGGDDRCLADRGNAAATPNVRRRRTFYCWPRRGATN
eukprot:5518607-Lingulodinium_polyedra.AAC.1